MRVNTVEVSGDNSGDKSVVSARASCGDHHTARLSKSVATDTVVGTVSWMHTVGASGSMFTWGAAEYSTQNASVTGHPEMPSVPCAL